MHVGLRDWALYARLRAGKVTGHHPDRVIYRKVPESEDRATV